MLSFPLFSHKSNFDILNNTIQELYSLLSVARSDQKIVIEINNPKAEQKMVIHVNGHMWTHTDNPMSELRELHTVLALNVKNNREITLMLEP
jgi:hypothetical protein